MAAARGRAFGFCGASHLVEFTLECQDGNEMHTVVIDPDIIIMPGTP